MKKNNAAALVSSCLLFLAACADKAAPNFVACSEAEKNGEFGTAVKACRAAVAADPKSESGLAAALKLDALERKRAAAEEVLAKEAADAEAKRAAKLKVEAAERLARQLAEERDLAGRRPMQRCIIEVMEEAEKGDINHALYRFGRQNPHFDIAVDAITMFRSQVVEIGQGRASAAVIKRIDAECERVFPPPPPLAPPSPTIPDTLLPVYVSVDKAILQSVPSADPAESESLAQLRFATACSPQSSDAVTKVSGDQWRAVTCAGKSGFIAATLLTDRLPTLEEALASAAAEVKARERYRWYLKAAILAPQDPRWRESILTAYQDALLDDLHVIRSHGKSSNDHGSECCSTKAQPCKLTDALDPNDWLIRQWDPSPPTLGPDGSPTRGYLPDVAEFVALRVVDPSHARLVLGYRSASAGQGCDQISTQIEFKNTYEEVPEMIAVLTNASRNENNRIPASLLSP